MTTDLQNQLLIALIPNSLLQREITHGHDEHEIVAALHDLKEHDLVALLIGRAHAVTLWIQGG